MSVTYTTGIAYGAIIDFDVEKCGDTEYRFSRSIGNLSVFGCGVDCYGDRRTIVLGVKGTQLHSDSQALVWESVAPKPVSAFLAVKAALEVLREEELLLDTRTDNEIIDAMTFYVYMNIG